MHQNTWNGNKVISFWFLFFFKDFTVFFLSHVITKKTHKNSHMQAIQHIQMNINTHIKAKNTTKYNTIQQNLAI